jgi:hypothetical protein
MFEQDTSEYKLEALLCGPYCKVIWSMLFVLIFSIIVWVQYSKSCNTLTSGTKGLPDVLIFVY